MLNERPEGKDKFGYVLIGLLVAFVIILVTSAVIWNSNHPEKVQENFEKIDTQQAEEKKGAKLGPYTIQLKDKKVVDCVGGALYTYSGINVIPTCDWDHPRQLAPDGKANRQATYVTLGNGEQVPCAGNSYIECGWQVKQAWPKVGNGDNPHDAWAKADTAMLPYLAGGKEPDLG